ncbi:MAG: putative fucosyltransferase [Harvfovirus sp.]|uniref:Putative fucosyltransferase n=1 Tax=Harvfovirus sp. TaxID=2487768 RepID=A0A3G5A0G4_9VIRU|nr:MAG: putative fucosyltransferase [Harvfovirus sp.]
MTNINYKINYEYQNFITNSICVNLQRRTDRKENMIKLFNDNNINVDFMKAVDGKNLEKSDLLKALYENNDFNYRKAIIGCSLSHVNLWLNLLDDTKNDYYIIYEDDIILAKNYKTKINKIIEQAKNQDIIFLGYHMYKDKKKLYDHIYNIDDSEHITLHPLNKSVYIGGTFGYIINKNGANQMMNYIGKNGIKHGIDYVMKINEMVNCYECQPMVIFSDCCYTFSSNVDSDIQKNYDFFDFMPEFVDYNFYPNQDSYGNDIEINQIRSTDISLLKNMADSDDRCVAFNTYGYLKHKIEKTFIILQNRFHSVDGMYIKKKFDNKYLKFEGYEFYPEKDSFGNDISCVTTDLDMLKNMADADEKCVAFNTCGYMKYKINPEFINLRRGGIYIKKNITLS